MVYDEDAIQNIVDVPPTPDDPEFDNSANPKQLFTADGERLPYNDGSGAGEVDTELR